MGANNNIAFHHTNDRQCPITHRRQSLRLSVDTYEKAKSKERVSTTHHVHTLPLLLLVQYI